MAAASQWSQVKYSQTMFGAQATQNGMVPGGLDLTTPSLKLNPGALRDMLNFEVNVNGGYTRIDGYERFDGRPAPSGATFTVVQLDQMIDAPNVGDLIFQVGSGAKGIVASVVTQPTPYLVLAEVQGVFDEMNALITLDDLTITAGGFDVLAGGLLASVSSLQTTLPPVIDPGASITNVIAGNFRILVAGGAVIVNNPTAQGH